MLQKLSKKLSAYSNNLSSHSKGSMLTSKNLKSLMLTFSVHKFNNNLQKFNINTQLDNSTKNFQHFSTKRR